MNEQEFKDRSEKALRTIEEALENCNLDMDFEWQGDGVLEICFEDHSKIIVNRHSAAQEIWVAARAGGFHFKYEAGTWVDTRDARPLAQKLSELASQQAGETITLLF
jgi:CyaY protein